MEIIKEWAGQSAFLASILAGFAVAAMLQLIGYPGGRRVARYAIVAFVVSAALLLAATAATSVILMRWEYWQQAALPQGARGHIIFVRDVVNRLVFGGLALFLAGLALAGWIHSRVTGAVATATAVIAALIVFWATRALP
jgi:hypothetical protein